MTRMGQSYRDLLVWRKAVTFVTDVYEATRQFPKDEQYGLTNQLRRAAISVPSNIAEGQARLSKKEFHYFLSTARGSLAEIETQLIIAKSLGYATPDQAGVLLARASELGRMLNGLLSSLKAAV